VAGDKLAAGSGSEDGPRPDHRPARPSPGGSGRDVVAAPRPEHFDCADAPGEGETRDADGEQDDQDPEGVLPEPGGAAGVERGERDGIRERDGGGSNDDGRSLRYDETTPTRETTVPG